MAKEIAEEYAGYEVSTFNNYLSGWSLFLYMRLIQLHHDNQKCFNEEYGWKRPTGVIK